MKISFVLILFSLISIIELNYFTLGNSIPHIFDPIRQQLREIDEFIRQEDDRDRKEFDEQIAVLAEKVTNKQNYLEQMNYLYEKVQKDRKYLLSKFGLVEELIDTYKLQREVYVNQTNLIDSECYLQRNLFEMLKSSFSRRTELLTQIFSELNSNPKIEKKLLAKSQELVQNLQVVISNEKSLYLPTEEQSDFCIVKKSYYQLQISKIDSQIESIKKSSTQWENDASDKQRQLITSEPVILGLQTEVSDLLKEIEKISNDFQKRHDSRSLQICEIVMARKAIETDEGAKEILPAILSGPSQTPEISGNIVYKTFQCENPKYKRNEVVYYQKVPCEYPPPSLGGRVPLGDEWAKLSVPQDCVPTKVVDINTSV